MFSFCQLLTQSLLLWSMGSVMKLSTLVLSYKLASCLLEMERWWGGGGDGGSTGERDWMPQVYRRKKGRRLWEDSYSWYTWLIIFSMLSWRFPPPHTLKFLYQWYLWLIFIFHFFYLFLLKLTDICSVRMFPFCQRNINFMFFYNKI